MPYTTVVAGTTITASWSNTNNRDQVVTPFASASARDSAITSPVNGMHCYLTDVDLTMVYDGTQWVRASSNIVKQQSLTANSSTISASATTDFALSSVVVHSTRLYKVSVFSTVSVSAVCVWRVNFHVDGTATTRIFDINTQSALDLSMAASVLWEPTSGTKALDLRVVEEAGASDLQFKAAGDNQRRFWVEDIGPR
jgi:hypothetical protein